MHIVITVNPTGTILDITSEGTELFGQIDAAPSHIAGILSLPDREMSTADMLDALCRSPWMVQVNLGAGKCYAAATARRIKGWFGIRPTIVITLNVAADMAPEAGGYAEHCGALAGAIGQDMGVVKFDGTGTIHWANDAFLQTQGLGPDDIVGQDQKVLFHHDDAHTTYHRRFWTGLQNGTPYSGLKRLVDVGGTPTWLRVNFLPSQGHSGQTDAIFMIAQVADQEVQS